MPLSRKDFEIIAESLRLIPSDETYTKDQIIGYVCKALVLCNPSFDAARFMAYAGSNDTLMSVHRD